MPDRIYDVCIIGGGPSGLMAACTVASAGLNVAVIEKNTSMGRKLLITGGGRCNVTNLLAPKDFIRECTPYDRFLRHAIHSFSPQDMVDFLEEREVETTVQGNNCVFPASEKSQHVLDCLLKENLRTGVKMIYDRKVETVEKTDNGFSLKSDKGTYSCRKLIIATGGASWPQTGSSGDGYAFAKSLGHKIAAPKACLVPLESDQYWIGRLAGVTLSRISLCVNENRKHPVTGGLVFTDSGIGGPAVLNFSRQILPLLERSCLEAFIDFVPELTIEELTARFNASITFNPKANFYNLLREFVPRSIGNVMADMVGINPRTPAGQLRKGQRRETVSLLKFLELTITGTRNLEVATVTRGGVANDEVNPKTMESKPCPDLYLCGEVLDIDGPCGGFNLQIAFSTGRLAGLSSAL